jgi:hypothetical protein
MKHITQITEQGLYYIDETGQTLFIDFDACYRKWYGRQLAKMDNWKEVVRLFNNAMRGWKEIGERNSIWEPPYITFYTEPEVTFEFETADQMLEIVYTIARFQCGWGIFDWS